MITTAVPTPAGAVRISQERRTSAHRIIDVSAAHTHPREDNLPRRTQRHRRQVLVNHLNLHIVDRATQQDRSPSGTRSITSWLVSSEVSVSPYAFTSLICGCEANQRCASSSSMPRR